MKLDKDDSGTIERDEFLSLPQVSSNPLATRMIAIFDEDGGGDVDFQEFVTGLSAFSSKGSKEEKLKFAFKVYDIDRDGYISNGELFIVLKMMVGSNLKDGQLQQIVDKTIMEADGEDLRIWRIHAMTSTVVAMVGTYHQLLWKELMRRLRLLVMSTSAV